MRKMDLMNIKKFLLLGFPFLNSPVKILRYFLLLALFVALKSYCHWDEKQVFNYVHDSELQRRSTWQLLSKVPFRGDETVLDIGCGDGRNTAWIACLVRNGTVFGIDPCIPMINWAKKQYHPLEFPNLVFALGDFESIQNLNIQKESCDVITSFFSLHIVKDKLRALEQIYFYLKPKGKFICVTPPLGTNHEYDEALKTTMFSPKWKSYFSHFVSTFKFIDLETYKSIITQSGLVLLEGSYQRSVDPFINAQAYVNWFKGTMPHVHYLPEDKQDEFIHDVLDLYLKLRPDAIAPEGTLYFYWGRYEFLAYKN